ncbi:elongation of very long chain fatty acids protein, putative [Pediculus humanus corporis]|uniref:Elongation of very long chain fatty acids protein n=1 Tax=Pediculus humanus subsp. corporis TaxID=121224 RepID=E0VWI9_PEDHC|nr:elongation of very long chain fatty acids protein, putative [Pediculus humanus corporis]EEB17744.1 elongation of very long chain fatty acids protein, putative [Pediculus humanus corporis]
MNSPATINWFDDINRLLNEKSDVRSRDWAFMDSPYPLITICVCYLYFVCKAGPQYMKNKKPYNLNKIITVYNAFQIFACLAIIYGMLSSFSLTRFGCESINHSDKENSYRVARWTWWATLLKLTEFLETIFFVLRKKQNQVSGLHLYHHVSTLSLGWITTKFAPGEPTVIPVVLNCIIHVLMYSYYLIALYGGKELQKKIIFWKRSLTILQMVQFTIIIAHIGSSLRSQCTAPKPLLILMLVNILINYIMFYKFYKNTYKKNKKLIE